MIRIKDNTLVIEVSKKNDKRSIHEIVDFASKRISDKEGEDILDMIERYHKFGKSVISKRDEIYNERLYIHRQ